MRQILLYPLSNFFDSINLIKLIWRRISGFRFTLIKTVNENYTEQKQIFLFAKVHLKDVLGYFAKFTGKHLCQSLSFLTEHPRWLFLLVTLP